MEEGKIRGRKISSGRSLAWVGGLRWPEARKDNETGDESSKINNAPPATRYGKIVKRQQLETSTQFQKLFKEKRTAAAIKRYNKT